MNIISNCCAGAYYYRDYLKSQYQNPFIWNIISSYDIYNLIKNYDHIDFTNYEMIKYDRYFKTGLNGVVESQYHYVVGLNIDNTFNVFYPHNYYDPKRKTPVIDNACCWYYRNFEYTVDNYEKRVRRMLLSKEPPIYLILTQNQLNYTEEISNRILSDFINDQIIMITSYKSLQKLATTKHRIILTENINISPQDVLKRCNLVI